MKTLAGYLMVLVHGYSMLSSPVINSRVRDPISPLWNIGGIISLGLPCIAGYYLRNIVELKTYQHRIDASTARFSFFLIPIAFGLEAIRLLILSFNPAIALSWQALHFIAFSTAITCLLAYIHEYLVVALALVVVASRVPLEHLFSQSRFSFSDLSSGHWLALSWLWAGVFFLISAYPLIAAWKLFKSVRVRLLLSPLVVFLAFWTGFSARHSVLLDHQALLDFANLPHDIFFSNRDGLNYWSFFVFFPVFASGYFFRWIIFKLNSYPALLMLIAVLVFFFSYLIVFHLRDYSALVGYDVIYTKAVFSMNLMFILGVASTFPLSVLAVYWVISKYSFNGLDRFSFYSRSIVTLYVVHTFFYALILRAMSNYIVVKLASVNHSFVFYYWLLTLIINVVYVFSIVASHYIISLLNMSWIIVENNRVEPKGWK